jgi:hypothetical protein
VFEQAKAVRYSDRAASVIGSYANNTEVFIPLTESSIHCGAHICIFAIFVNATSITFTFSSYIYLQTFPVFVKKESTSYS